MNVVALDRRTSARLTSLPARRTRPRVIRRVVKLPGLSGMRRPEWEPTPLTVSEHKRIPISYGEETTERFHGILVVGSFLSLFFRLMWMRFRGKASPKNSGIELRKTFEHLGGFWMKVGQLVSLRRDALPVQVCDELAQLQHRAIGFPPSLAMRIIEDALGAPINEIFSEFDPVPMAAASLSQVHAARLKKGNKDVVVKVLRPGVRERFARDMRVLRVIAAIIDRFPRLRRLRMREALVELEEILKEETDYRYEISNMRELRRTTRGHKVYVPHVYRKFSRNDVIVMERISGVLMSDFIRISNEEPERIGAWLKANNIKTPLVAKRLLISFMRQLFENNLFHADLHPGNIILLRDSRIALIDLGSVGSLDREFLTLYRGLQRALATNDFGRAADLQLRLCVQLPSRNMRDLRTELIRALRLWSIKTKIPHLPFHERSVNNGASEVSRVMWRYGAQQSWEFLKIARTLSTLDGSLSYLHEELNYIEILKSYFDQASKRAIIQTLKPRSIANSIGSLAATLEEYHLMLGPLARASAFNFEATVSKVSRVFATIVKVLSFAVLLVLAVAIYRLSFGHDSRYTSPVFDAIMSSLPELEYGWWIVLISGGVIILFTTWRIIWELMQPEDATPVRGP